MSPDLILLNEFIEKRVSVKASLQKHYPNIDDDVPADVNFLRLTVQWGNLYTNSLINETAMKTEGAQKECVKLFLDKCIVDLATEIVKNKSAFKEESL